MLKLQKNPVSPSVLDYLQSPLVVKSNFMGKAASAGGDGKPSMHVQLMSAMLGNLFPPIEVESVSVKNCRRVVLANYDAQTGDRHEATARVLAITE